MIKKKDDKWLEGLIEECAESLAKKSKTNEELAVFRLVITRFTKQTERMLDETWALWELEPDSRKLREKFHILEKHLSYVRRFCQGKIKGKYQTE